MDAREVGRLIDANVLNGFNVGVHERNGMLVVNDKIAVPVKCDISMPRDSDLDVHSPEGEFIGVLCFSSAMSFEPLDKSDYQLAAYLTEVEFNGFSLDMRLQSDYLVLDELSYDDYMRDCAKTSALWGGFSHAGYDGELRRRKLGAFVRARGGMKLIHPSSEALCVRATAAAHPFERFLKHYHQLELLGDWYLVRRMARLPPSLLGLDKLMSSYGSSDIDKIKGLVMEFCVDSDQLAEMMDPVKDHWDVATEIFHDYGKKGNPINNKVAWENLKNSGPAAKDVAALSAYWLFRVRCSIAHHRVGEYLMTEDDQGFVVDFAEPLLLEVIRQVLSNEKLHILE
ncbi:hypothetical protein [Stenotrophomonas maltophilia]|uniref:hypothetical protein n=1 Tax=Stenotrophomonas maltophilia TaxID=40324 RepID=UPI001F52CC04|nr:hypothetical protein [Stenotrophomonas maltophilia]